MVEENTDLERHIRRGDDHAADADIARRRLIALAEESGLPFDELLELWADDTEQQLEAASTALGAGNLIEAARLVHSASGASGICGVDALASQLKIVETLAVLGRPRHARQALEQAQVRFACLSGALLSGART
jgi:HPt (histidine-containing phosphotransfer) domain-containing protein